MGTIDQTLMWRWFRSIICVFPEYSVRRMMRSLTWVHTTEQKAEISLLRRGFRLLNFPLWGEVQLKLSIIPKKNRADTRY